MDTSKKYYRPYYKEEVEYLRAIDYLQTPVWIYDPFRWRQMFANEAGLRVWNSVSLEEFQNKDFRDNSEATDRFLQGLSLKFQKSLEKGERIQPVCTIWTIYPDNQPTPLSITFSHHISQCKNVDVEQLIMPNRVLLVCEGKLPDPTVIGNIRSLEALRHVTAMVTMYDTFGRIVLRNRASETELVLENDEPIDATESLELNAHTFLPYIYERKSVETIIQSIHKGEDIQLQVEVKLKKGTRVHSVHALRILDPVSGGQLILVHEDDITEAVEQQKENLSVKLAGKMKDEFLANTSHELKTPLHGIIGLAEVISDDPTFAYLSEECKTNVGLIVESANRMSNLVNDILDLARLARSDISLNKRHINLYNLVEITFKICAPIAKRMDLRGASIEFINEIPKDMMLYADEGRIKQVFQNLVSNAIKFMDLDDTAPQKYIKVTAQKIHQSQQGADVPQDLMCIKVIDTGMGIAERTKKLIFEPFISTIEESQRKKFDVTGLGLAITKKLVELHGGSISVESEGIRGRGSVFTILIPTQEDLLTEASVQNSPSSFIPPRYSPPRHDMVEVTPIRSPSVSEPLVLCVDDDPINLKILGNLLKRHGIRTAQAINGQQALDMIDKMEVLPNLILLDVMMPGIDGFVVCARLRERYSQTQLPIVLLSANSQHENILKGIQAGANAYMSKPFDKEIFLQKIKSFCNIK